MTHVTSDESQGVAWRAFFDEARERLAAAGFDSPDVDARRIVEEAAGADPGEFHAALDDLAMKRGVAHFDAMLERRLRGEPLQYVLGRWGFRTLDLAVDARVLIPRPETEGVAGLALDEVRRRAAQDPDRAPLVADLGTGSGCIGLSIAAEHKTAQVVLTDRNPDAIALARANTIGMGRPAERVEIHQGDWFGAIASDRAGTFDVIVSNPPYIGDDESLPAQVGEWEPTDALFAGPDGLEHARILIAQAFDWLRPGGALVLELGETQLGAAKQLAVARGYVDVDVHQDLAGKDRALVARKPRSGTP